LATGTPTLETLGNGDYVIRGRFSAVANADVLTLPIPGGAQVRKVRVVRFRAELISGAATVITPELTTESGGTGDSVILLGEADTVTDPLIDTGIAFLATEANIYLKPTPDAGNDNVVSVLVCVTGGRW
jgi:hypothetical protein